MAGILNNKNRVLDVILTELGRQQMNRGEFEISYATFSDQNARYENIGDSVLMNLQDEIYFETYSSSADEIVPEIDNQGNFLLTKKLSPTLSVKNGILYEKTAAGFSQVDGFASISKFTDLTINRWKSLNLLKTENTIPTFSTSVDGGTLKVSNEKLEALPNTVNGLNPILVDGRFSGTINTMFLPPKINYNGASLSMKAFNEYATPYSKENQLAELQSKSLAKLQVIIGQDDSYENYNILSQMYIGKNQSVKKFLVVDAGEFLDDEGVPSMRIYHLGFIYKDQFGTSKFSRGFSIVFHNEG